MRDLKFIIEFENNRESKLMCFGGYLSLCKDFQTISLFFLWFDIRIGFENYEVSKNS